MSSNDLPDIADPPELDPFFASVGRLVVAWGHLEAGLDSSIRAIHFEHGNSQIEKDFPIMLKRKIKYMRRITKIIKDKEIQYQYLNLLEEISKETTIRHLVIHGFVVSNFDTLPSVEFGKFDIRNPGAIPETAQISIKAINVSASHIREIASVFVDLARRLYS